ncbi:MAG: ABC transporter permease [Galbitalea sp.]
MSTDNTPGVAPAASGIREGRRRLPPWRSIAILIPFLVLFIALSIGSAPFLNTTNLLNILDQQSATLIIAAAGTLVLISGGIDLSVGATYALSGVISAQLALSNGVVVAVIVGLLVGIVVGLANGVISTLFRINSLIAHPGDVVHRERHRQQRLGRQPDRAHEPAELRGHRPDRVPRRAHLDLDRDRRGRRARPAVGTNHQRPLHVRRGRQRRGGAAGRHPRQLGSHPGLHPERRRRGARRNHRHLAGAEARSRPRAPRSPSPCSPGSWSAAPRSSAARARSGEPWSACCSSPWSARGSTCSGSTRSTSRSRSASSCCSRSASTPGHVCCDGEPRHHRGD